MAENIAKNHSDGGYHSKMNTEYRFDNGAQSINIIHLKSDFNKSLDELFNKDPQIKGHRYK